MKWALLGLLALGCKNVGSGPPLTGFNGAPCETAEDCIAPDAICLAQHEGYCSRTCETGLTCGAGALCEAADGAHLCLDGCLVDNANSDCREGYRCSPRPKASNLDGRGLGVCLPLCQGDADCAPGSRCEPASGDCLPSGGAEAGSRCDEDTDCRGGLCLRGERFRGGYCSGRCGPQFLDCEAGALCMTVGAAAACLQPCQGAADCRAEEGYVCRRSGWRTDQGVVQAVAVCAPRCGADTQCPDAQHCDPQSGDCLPGVGAPKPLGAFCSEDADCQSGDCRSGAGAPGGYCSEACGACAICGRVEGEAGCLHPCERGLDCRPGYLCVEGGCTGPCAQDADCPSERSCSPVTQRCVEPGGDTELIAIEVASEVEVSRVESRELSFELPTGVLGFALMAEGHGADPMVASSVIDPSGAELYSFQDPVRSPLRFFPTEDLLTHLVPSSPRTAPLPGTWRVRFTKEGGRAEVDVRVLAKRADGVPTNGRLEVNLFLAQLRDLQADTALQDPDLQQTIARLREIYGSRGIDLAHFHVCQLPEPEAGALRIIESTRGGDSELGELLAWSARAGDLGCTPEPALNFFMVEEIQGSRAGYTVLGVAGGIPGPPEHGTRRSGVAVSMAGFRHSPGQLALTMAHEAGHYLGLFHTSEASGRASDPLADTPTCGPDRDDDADGLVDYGECEGAGRDNLMFWAAGAEADGLTADQGFVLLRNPVVR